MRQNIWTSIRRARILLVLSALGIVSTQITLAARAEYLHLKMGNPSRATTNAANKNNYLMTKKDFALSYNDRKGTPNWVSWRLVKSNIGRAPRVGFFPDADLPKGFKRVSPSDYTGSGFDRGHLCPHGDRSASASMGKSTFVMTNIAPQSPDINRNAWNQLEMYCRDIVNVGNVLYIVDGVYGVGGIGSNGRSTTIGKGNQVTVPSKCWKVIMILNGKRGDDLRKVNSKTRIIAVIMPNDMKVADDWSKYRVSVAEVEKLTGYKFFDKAPAAIVGPLKKKVDRVRVASTQPIYSKKSSD